MHCKTCNYPLWDVKARVCPECGQGFDPTQYEFIINSVQFLCPHCRQDYYGTGENGHLVPRTFACVKCGTFIDEAQMLVLPAAGVREEQTVGGTNPWPERAKRGRFASFFATIGLTAFLPVRFARYCGREDQPGEAAVFATVALVLYGLFGIGWFGLMISLMGTARLGMQASTPDILSAILIVGAWIVGPVIVLGLLTLLWAGMAQLIISVGNPKPVGFARTLECFFYSWGAGFILAVPCVGAIYGLIPAMIWVAVSAGIQIAIRQQVSTARAILAAASLPALAVLLICGWIGYLIAVG